MAERCDWCRIRPLLRDILERKFVARKNTAESVPMDIGYPTDTYDQASDMSCRAVYRDDLNYRVGSQLVENVHVRFSHGLVLMQ